MFRIVTSRLISYPPDLQQSCFYIHLHLCPGGGVQIPETARMFLLIVISCTPLLFMYIDAWYATNAQNLRARRNEITYFLNFGEEPLFQRIARFHDAFTGKSKDPPVVMDLTGYLTVRKDPQTIYRRSLIAKLTRRHRLLFYSFQMVGSLVVLSHYLASNNKNSGFYLFIIIYIMFLGFLFWANHIKRQKIAAETPQNYHKEIDNKADIPSYSSYNICDQDDG